nr:hypothetical protein [Aeromonas hydrophila]
MANWRRAWWPGGTWFFTVNLLERCNNRLLLLVEQIDLLRHSVAKVQQAHPFAIHAWVVLPDPVTPRGAGHLAAPLLGTSDPE